MFNGKLIPAEKVIYNSKILGKDFINVDDQRYEINDVKFYQGLDGFYANSKKYQVGNFLKRKEEGNANIYWFSGSVSSTTSGPGGYHPPGTGYTITQTSTKTTFFYNIGFEDLKKMKYRNLKLDFANHPDAMIHVNKYKRTRNIKRTLLIGGAAMMLSTVLTVDSSVDYLAAGSATIGATSLLVGVFWGMGRDKHLYKAMNVYNGSDSFTF